MELSSISDRTGERIEVLISEIDWSIFTSDAYLSDISIAFLDQQTTEPTGTTIEIFELNESWSQEKVNQLFLELRKLVSPLHRSAEHTSELQSLMPNSSACFCLTKHLSN